ncbi:Uncharacterized iron-regulated membrane protein [Pedobacter steynii]|uniref:Uncharacterized iron-regulated membrane protein n=1 Tax=Pedobacter steynii TaxID=430522 RepID=A0A1H0AIP8_9SPHI|nr:PepSY-associated TM helix domain-containing protein [Pedobacter steynii]NQX41352.1 PepSY domain-containing protein [Pedobacter steynii]SDN33194.1 Uncharacterized iron-regulated membrane protein [Pedobacter steynii]
MFRKINNWLHLWMGLVSGVIMFIVCLTACLFAFNEEIRDLIYPPVKVSHQAKPVIPPSRIKTIVAEHFPGEPVTMVTYKKGRAIEVIAKKWDDNPMLLFLSPYTGKVLEKRIMLNKTTKFFYFIEEGHRTLWLPWETGRLVVNYGTLIFVFLLISGLIWWYPKKWNKSTRDKSFKIKWTAKWKRVNIDLHNVLGFYSLILLLILSLTGMIYGLKWFSKGLYWSTSAGASLPAWKATLSDTTKMNAVRSLEQVLDQSLDITMRRFQDAEGYTYRTPDTANHSSSIEINAIASLGKTYADQSLYFDRHTGKEITKEAYYAASFKEAPFGTKLRRLNYDIHLGQVLGLPGKIIAFLVSLIGASLPVTGFIIWYNRKFGKKGKKKKV